MLSNAHRRRLENSGFVIVREFVPMALVEFAIKRFDPLFLGEFETGIQPDEWNWREGVSPPDHTRWPCPR